MNPADPQPIRSPNASSISMVVPGHEPLPALTAGELPATAAAAAADELRAAVTKEDTGELPGVERGYLPGCPALPRLITPKLGGSVAAEFSELRGWALEHRRELARELRAHGAVLFRGFPVASARDFEALARDLDGKPMDYVAGTADRRVVDGNVQTTTSMPPYFKIALHHEMAYRAQGPRGIFFFCRHPALFGGQTILADSRRVFQDIPADSRARLNAKPIRLERRLASADAFFAPLLKLSRALRMTTWQEVFKTSDRAEVEVTLRDQGYQFRWGSAGSLSFWNDLHVVQSHPETGEPVWFRPLHFFYATTRVYGRAIYSLLRLGFALARKPFPVLRYGDGEPVAARDLQRVLDALEKNEVYFKWEMGDVLWVDNRMIAHGRNRYFGRRDVLVVLTG